MKKEEKQTKQSKGKLAYEIISYSVVFVFFLLSLTCAIFKFAGAQFTLFGTRYDVVLTDSMSYKNKNNEDFLKNDNNQFKAFDLAVSKPLPARDQIKEHDIVIYKDRRVGTNMHRVVKVIPDAYDELTYNDARFSSLDGTEGIELCTLGSEINSTSLNFTTLEMRVFSNVDYGTTKHFNFGMLRKTYEPTITQIPSNGGYLYIYKVSKDSVTPGRLSIAHSTEYDFSSERILSLTICASNGCFESKIGDGSLEQKENDLVGKYNKTFKYEIRGDANKDSDGLYSYDELEAIVVNNVPNAGYVVRFFNSVWGAVMFLLLGFLILAVDIISTKIDKKQAKEAAEKNYIDVENTKASSKKGKGGKK